MILEMDRARVIQQPEASKLSPREALRKRARELASGQEMRQQTEQLTTGHNRITEIAEELLNSKK